MCQIKKKKLNEGTELSKRYYNLLGQIIGTSIPSAKQGVFIEVITYDNGDTKSRRIVIIE